MMIAQCASILYCWGGRWRIVGSLLGMATTAFAFPLVNVAWKKQAAIFILPDYIDAGPSQLAARRRSSPRHPFSPS